MDAINPRFKIMLSAIASHPLVRRVLLAIRAKSVVGGLEISDSALRYAFFDGLQWKLSTVVMPPGIMERGRIRNAVEFNRMLRLLHHEIFQKDSKRTVHAIISLGSLHSYTQTFVVPALEEKNLKSAIDLNIQMNSPLDMTTAYAGYEVIGREPRGSSVEVLAAYAERGVIDPLTQAFLAAGFLAVAVEPKALSLARVISRWGQGADSDASYLLVVADESGIDAVILRRGQLYFEYFQAWSDIQGEARAIDEHVLEDALNRTITQVRNFYMQHWSDPISAILVSSTSGEE